MDKFVTDEFLTHVVYGCQIVVTNPTSSRQKLDVLLQMPVGSIPASNGKFTRTLHLDLEPYHTQTGEYYFYFPVAGEFSHYPVQVAKNERLVAHAGPFTFNVAGKDWPRRGRIFAQRFRRFARHPRATRWKRSRRASI